MTIYKDLKWEKLSDKLREFMLDYDSRKLCKLNGIEIHCNRIAVNYNEMIFSQEHWESYPSSCWDDEYYDDDVYVSKDIAKIKYLEEQRFDLVVDWDWFEIKLK